MGSFFLCYQGEALENPILSWVCKKKYNNVDSNNDRQIYKIIMLKFESTVDINKKNKNTIYIYMHTYV